MEFSVFIIGPTAGQGSEAEVYASILREIRLSDELGFDMLWFAEHHFDTLFSTSPSPNLFLAIAARETRRIKLGTAITVLPFHHPTRIAEEGAMLDLLSNGRFQWGIGRGITGHEFQSYSLDSAHSWESFVEAHDAVLAAWRTGRMAHDGVHVKVPPTEIAPRVVQQPHPPVWMTAQSPKSVEWAAAHDYPAMQIGEDLATGAQQRARYEAAARQAGVAVRRGGIVPLRMVCVASTDAEAREIAAERVVRFWDHTARTTAPVFTKSPGAAAGTAGYEYWLTMNPQKFVGVGLDGLMEAGLVLAGSPGTVIDQVQRQIDALGCRQIMCDFWRASGIDAREGSMRLFANEVIPAFRERTPARAVAE
ncbi:LLM class flavin-dependent oxidoreductase [Zavarzinia sp. CC-PAN008]|uniref:LLM class flavin-dependent oxidoreductase n=1 Tax=Zavarzinia sp. CC-PAN008 TaxID=3243332 RepID=UPI003F74507B